MAHIAHPRAFISPLPMRRSARGGGMRGMGAWYNTNAYGPQGYGWQLVAGGGLLALAVVSGKGKVTQMPTWMVAGGIALLIASFAPPKG